jgi:glycosyltransferase involved in cell wall biosynthesis
MFSVIIPAYNSGKLIKEAIESVLSQSFRDFELIVVDDGSTDGTLRNLAGYSGNIQVIFQKNSGAGTARNKGAEVAKGEYLVFLDHDDLLMPWALAVYAKVVSATDHPALIIGRMINFDHNKPDLPTNPGADVEAVVYKDFLSKDRQAPKTNSCIVVRKDIFQQLCGYRCELTRTFACEDADFLIRAGVYGPAVVVIKPTTVAYRLHQGNTVKNTTLLVNSVLQLIRFEKEGIYPGGWSRLFDRYASIGALVFLWSKIAFSHGCPSEGLWLFTVGFPMVAAGALRKMGIRMRGKIPPIKINVTY